MRRVAREAVEDAAADGCDFLEIRFGPATHVRPGFAIADVIAAACDGLADGRRATGLAGRARRLPPAPPRRRDEPRRSPAPRPLPPVTASSGSTSRATSCSFRRSTPLPRAVRDRGRRRAGADGPRRRGGPGGSAVEAVDDARGDADRPRVAHRRRPRGPGLGRGRGGHDRGLPDLERPDRGRTLAARASAPRVPRGRLPGRPRRRQPDQHRRARSRRRSALLVDGRRADRGAAPPRSTRPRRRRVHRRVDAGDLRKRFAAESASPTSAPPAPPGSAATRSPCSGPSRPPARPSAAIRAASQFTTPSWSHRQRAPTATASSGVRHARAPTGGTRRRCRTGPVAATASASVAERRDPEHAPLVRVDRDALEALVDEVPEHAERRPPLVRRRARRRRSAARPAEQLLDPARRRRPRPARDPPARSRKSIVRRCASRSAVRVAIVRQLAPSLTYGRPSAAGGMLRPTTPARTIRVRRYGSAPKKLL